MQTFDDLVTSRKGWIEDILRKWCQQANRAELIKAEAEWLDIAGKVSPDKTLWPWAWSRFPDLVHENLGIEETTEVLVELRGGTVIQGFPDSRKSLRGQLIVWGRSSKAEAARELGPFSIDNVVAIRKANATDESSI